MALIPSKRASKVVASKEPTSSSSRSAVRRYSRARAMSSKEPLKLTFASAFCTSDISIFLSWKAVTDSSPSLVVAMNLIPGSPPPVW